MAKIDLFEAANRLEDTHPFVLLTCLASRNQSVDPTLEFDEELLPLAARWLGTRMRGGEDSPPPDEAPDDGEPSGTTEEVRALGRILRRLRNNAYFGGRHTSETNFRTGVPGHLLGFAADACERLVHLGIVERKNTTSGPHIWLNERRLADIEALIAGRVEDPGLRSLCGLE